jgi:hypothetical protein
MMSNEEIKFVYETSAKLEALLKTLITEQNRALYHKYLAEALQVRINALHESEHSSHLTELIAFLESRLPKED